MSTEAPVKEPEVAASNQQREELQSAPDPWAGLDFSDRPEGEQQVLQHLRSVNVQPQMADLFVANQREHLKSVVFAEILDGKDDKEVDRINQRLCQLQRQKNELTTLEIDADAGHRAYADRLGAEINRHGTDNMVNQIIGQLALKVGPHINADVRPKWWNGEFDKLTKLLTARNVG